MHHRFQLLKVCNQYVTLPNSTRVKSLLRKVLFCDSVRVHIILINDKSVCVLSEQTGWLFTYRSHHSCIPTFPSDFHCWEDHFSSVFHSELFDEQAPITSLSVLGSCSFHELRGIWLSYLGFLGSFWCSRGKHIRILFAASREQIHHRLRFAVTLSSLASSCGLFDITSEQLVELKWLMLDKHKRWFHSSRVKFPLVGMSASWFLVTMYLIWIFWVQMDSIESLAFFGLHTRPHRPAFDSTHQALLASGPRASLAHPLPAAPFQCPRSRTATLGKGAAAHFPALTLAWLYIELFLCGGVRPASDPVDSDPGALFEDDPHPRSDAGRPLEPCVCRHTREPTVLSRQSCRPFHLNVDRFHKRCLLPWRKPLLPPKHGWLLGRDRWGLSVPRTTWRPLTLAGSPNLPPLRLTGGIATGQNGTTAGCKFILPPVRVPHPSLKGCLQTCRFGDPRGPRRRLFCACLLDHLATQFLTWNHLSCHGSPHACFSCKSCKAQRESLVFPIFFQHS